MPGYAADKVEKTEKKDNVSTQSAKQGIADAVITTKIKAAYAKDKVVSMLRISVDTDDKGVVTLGGTAKSKAEVDQAVKLAREVEGVKSVRNDIRIDAAK